MTPTQLRIFILRRIMGVFARAWRMCDREYSRSNGMDLKCHTQLALMLAKVYRDKANALSEQAEAWPDWVLTQPILAAPDSRPVAKTAAPTPCQTPGPAEADAGTFSADRVLTNDPDRIAMDARASTAPVSSFSPPPSNIPPGNHILPLVATSHLNPASSLDGGASICSRCNHPIKPIGRWDDRCMCKRAVCHACGGSFLVSHSAEILCGKCENEVDQMNLWLAERRGGGFRKAVIMRMSRIAKGSHHHSWASRDYEDVACAAVGCLYNRQSACLLPSRRKLDETARCLGFDARSTPKKVDGD